MNISTSNRIKVVDVALVGGATSYTNVQGANRDRENYGCWFLLEYQLGEFVQVDPGRSRTDGVIYSSLLVRKLLCELAAD